MKKELSMMERAERRGVREDGAFTRLPSLPRSLLKGRKPKATHKAGRKVRAA